MNVFNNISILLNKHLSKIIKFGIFLLVAPGIFWCFSSSTSLKNNTTHTKVYFLKSIKHLYLGEITQLYYYNKKVLCLKKKAKNDTLLIANNTEYYNKIKNYKLTNACSKTSDSLLLILNANKKEEVHEINNHGATLSTKISQNKKNEINSYKTKIISINTFVIILCFLAIKLLILTKQHKKEKEKVKYLLAENEKATLSKIYMISVKNDLLKNINAKIEKLVSANHSSIKQSDVLALNRDILIHLQNDEIWKEFKLYFEKTHPDFFDKLLRINKKLTQKDLKQSAYIISGLSSKDVSKLIGVSVRSVETSRYRLKKKLHLDSTTDLRQFLNHL